MPWFASQARLGLSGVKAKRWEKGGPSRARPRPSSHTARRNPQLVHGVGLKAAGEAQARPVLLDREIIDRWRDPERLASPHDVERRGLAREAQGEAALDAGLVLARSVVVIGVVGNGWGATQHPVLQLTAQSPPAGQLRNPERHRSAQLQLERLIVEAGLVREAQADDDEAPVGYRLAQRDDVGLLVAARRPLKGLHGEILAAEDLPLPRREAGQRAQLDRKEARQRRGVDRLREGQGDLVEVGDAVGPALRGGLHGSRQERHEAGLVTLGRDLNSLQRLPGFGRAELQGAGTEPLPGAGLLGRHGDDALGTILRPALLRAEVAIEEQRDRVPGLEELLGHEPGAISPLHPVEGGGGRSGRLRKGRGRYREGSESRKSDRKAFHGRLPQRVSAGARPTISRYFKVISAGGPAGGGAMPSTVGRTVVATPSAGTRASRT